MPSGAKWATHKHGSSGFVNVGAPCFEVEAHLKKGSDEYILGVTSSGCESVKEIINDHNLGQSCLCLIGECDEYSDVYPATKSLPVLSGGFVRMEVRGDEVTFHGEEASHGPYRLKGGIGCRYRPCLFIYWEGTVVRTTHRALPLTANCASFLGADLHKKRKYTDAFVCCGGQQIPVHRAVLARSSEVFDTMFESGMREGSESSINIVDAPPEAVQQMIEFMYTGDGIKETHLVPVYALAKKYMMPNLAQEVGRKLVSSVGSGNLSEYLRSVRLHARSGDTEASQLWQLLMKKLDDEKLLVGALETILDSGV
eukprot:TRINITY_DN31743_c0_g1_i1.p1 TRINITY_DN31743_c0_g1~~TRINITY_DN31743_c0_g1_i1.p1  ORF type:complete len:312 (-),score=24.69 TRINITY_DN31743_c0_g1_i1:51-986(-)